MSVLRRILLTCLTLLPVPIWAQFYSNPFQAGQGGMSFFVGARPESAFSNPSALMLTDNDEKLVLSFFSGGVYKSSGFTGVITGDPKSVLSPFFSASLENDYLFEKNSDDLLNAWFGPFNTQLDNIQSVDITTVGFLFKSTDMAFSFSHRMRGQSVSKVSRGWYDATFNSLDDTYSLTRGLNQFSTYWHEIAVGVAWEQGLLSGMTGSRSAIYVGVNPKIILPVEYFDGTYYAEYTMASQESNQVQKVHRVSVSASGENCTFVTQTPISCSTSSPNWNQISGFGAGFDAGISWRLSLGNSIRLRNDLRPVSDYQISLSVSVSDIGFVSHTNTESITTHDNIQTIEKNSLSRINTEYRFSPFSYFDFISKDQVGPLNAENIKSETVTYLTPSTFTAGIGLELDRIRLGMQYQQYTGSRVFDADYSSIHVGNEISLIPFLSVRSGLILQPDEPIIYTAGLGFDTTWLSISASTMAKQLDTNNSLRPVMMNVGTLSLKF